jgi:hypothetical protein
VADYTFTLAESTKAGIPDIAGTVVGLSINHVHGNTLGTADYARIPNDGKVVLLMDSVTGTTLTFTPVLCSHGRTEALAPVTAASKFVCFGPWSPATWNQADGCVIFKLTAGNANDVFLALRTGNPT